MGLKNIPFQTINWDNIPAVEYKGETGTAYWRTVHYEHFRVRKVEYSKNYEADHWCSKGHIIYCIDGEMVTELSDGREFPLRKGMAYIVSDDMSLHRTYSKDGVQLIIIDGDFLKLCE